MMSVPGRQQDKLAAGVPALADVERRAPVFEREGPGDRDGELTVRGALGKLAEHVAARCLVLVEAVADAELGRGGEVADGQDAAGIASGGLDEIGQHAAGWRGVQDQVHWSPGGFGDPSGQPVAVGRYRRSQRAQPSRVGVTRGGDHAGSPQQTDLDNGEPDGRARPR